MRTLLLVLSLLVGAAAPGLAQSAASDWKLWRYSDLHLELRAPSPTQPVVKHATMDFPADGALPAITVSNDQIVVVDGGQYAMLVAASDWTGNSNPMNIDGVVEGAVKEMKVALIGAVRTRAWPGGEERDYDAKTGDKVVRCRVILVHRRLYQAMSLSLNGVLPPETDAFLAAVRPLD